MVNYRALLRFLPVLSCVVLAALATACQPTVDERVERAERLVEAGDYRAAVIELKNALQQDTENAKARLLLARSTAQLGDYPTAISEYERVLGLGDTRETVWIEFGRALLRQGRTTEVVDRVLPNLSEASPGVDIAILHGNAMAALGNMEQAQVSFERALEINAAEAEALVGLAVIASGQGDDPKARELIERAIELNPDSAFAWRAKGNYLRVRGELEEAVSAYAKSISLETPQTPLADQFSSRVNRASILLDTRKTDEAEAEIQELAKLLPQHPLLSYLRGRLAYDRGEFDAAQQYFQEYLSMVPGDFRAHAMLGAVNL
jgi:tetratricopeptide (TPR) repeat protein